MHLEYLASHEFITWWKHQNYFYYRLWCIREYIYRKDRSILMGMRISFLRKCEEMSVYRHLVYYLPHIYRYLGKLYLKYTTLFGISKVAHHLGAHVGKHLYIPCYISLFTPKNLSHYFCHTSLYPSSWIFNI